MVRNSFDEELNALHFEIIEMGSMIEKQIDESIIALINQDELKAKYIMDRDDLVDNMEIKIEEKCISLIARQQPLAIDLRRIFTAIKIVTDLERIGDHAVDIAKITIKLSEEKYIKPLIDIPIMAEIVQGMIKDSLDAYVNLDNNMAEEICKRDDSIDLLYKQVFNELLVIMSKDSEVISQATQFLFVCKFLERIADHVTNICEWIVYLVTGEYKDLNEG